LSAVPFAELPDDARVWVFASQRPLTPEQRDSLLAAVDEFLVGWHAHRRPVVGGRDWRYDHFLLIGADEVATGVSGCSIDSLFRSLQQLEPELGTGLLDSSPVWLRNEGGQVEALSRGEFRERVRTGRIGPDTVVFDNTVRTAGQVRRGEWEKPARDSWHARLL
jgi:hypothetical protein